MDLVTVATNILRLSHTARPMNWSQALADQAKLRAQQVRCMVSYSVHTWYSYTRQQDDNKRNAVEPPDLDVRCFSMCSSPAGWGLSYPDNMDAARMCKHVRA